MFEVKSFSVRDNLDIRAIAASQAMGGIMASHHGKYAVKDQYEVATLAVACADALMLELQK